VGADVVAGNHGAGAAAEQEDGVGIICADEVPGDGRVRRTSGDANAADGVAAVERAGDIGADVVALEDVSGRCAAGDLNPVAGVAADDVALGRGRAADQVVGVADGDAAAVAQRGGAGGIQADDVALDLAVVQSVDHGITDRGDRDAGAVAGNHV